MLNVPGMYVYVQYHSNSSNDLRSKQQYPAKKVLVIKMCSIVPGPKESNLKGAVTSAAAKVAVTYLLWYSLSTCRKVHIPLLIFTL